MPKNTAKKKKRKNILLIISIKLILILILILGLFYFKLSFENSISLLAVNTDGEEIKDGSIINLNLKIKPGSGQTFVKLNTIEEVDTQISIINSQKTACKLFELNCDNYDFFYEFDGSALILKGPSASSAIAILVAKTVNKEKINHKTVITGSLNSGGLIGVVGGVEEKIEVAKKYNFTKILIPLYSNYNESKHSEGKVIKVFDIIDAYNNFNGDSFELKEIQTNNSEYKFMMKKLAEEMCIRSTNLGNLINSSSIKENSTLKQDYNNAIQSFNSSQIANSNGNYYSQGSFCFNSNLNYRDIIETQKNESSKQIDNKISVLNIELNSKYNEINSQTYKSKIKTTNDFYVYLLLNDRLQEAIELINDANEIAEKSKSIIDIINISNTNSTITINNKTNTTNQSNSMEEISNKLKIKVSQRELDEKNSLYSYALERYYTVSLWEKLITNKGSEIKFSDETISEACMKINREISLKSELLQNYNINFFNENINKQLTVNNEYICIYKGLELNAQINTILNAPSINLSEQKNYSTQLIKLTQTRINLNSNGEFQIIPTIYHEYSQDLFNEKNYASSNLYSNFALSYADLNLYLEKETQTKKYITIVLEKLFSNITFITAFLLIIAFIS